MIERNAFVGGCDGVAVTKSAELIQEDPMGTIPHALVLIMGDTVEAVRAFHEIVDKKVRRVALIDTLQDEKFEALRVAGDEPSPPEAYSVGVSESLFRARELKQVSRILLLLMLIGLLVTVLTLLSSMR